MKIIFRKILAFTIAVLMLIMGMTITTSATGTMDKEKIYFGDVDDNELINAEDALSVLKHASKLKLIDEALVERADVDANGIADAADALEILKYAALLINEFPVSSITTETPSATPDVTETPKATETNSPEPAISDTPSPTESETIVPTETITPTPTEKEDIEMPSDFSGTVWIMGDSIAANHEKTATIRPLYGWGEVIGDYFTSDVSFMNHAISSQSTSSYYSLNRMTYDYVFNCMKENDYVIISYGHNDHNTAKLNGFDRTTDPEAGTDTQYSYKWWLKNYYIDPVLEKGAVPILMSSVVRCTFENGTFYETDIHMKYGVAMEELVAEYANQGITIYYIDAQDYTYNLYSTLSQEEAKLYHGQYGREATNYFDNTHYSEAGARMIVEYMISELKKTELSIVDFIK